MKSKPSAGRRPSRHPGGRALQRGPVRGRESSLPPCFSPRAPPRSSSSITSARGHTHNQAPPGTHGLSDSGRTAGSQSPVSALVTKHTLGANAATHHAREHLPECEEIQRAFHTGVSCSEPRAANGTLPKHSVSLGWAARHGRARGLLQLPLGLPPLLVLRENLPEGPLRLDGKESSSNAGHTGSIPGLGKIAWRRKWQPTPRLLPGKSHEHRSRDAESQTRLSN